MVYNGANKTKAFRNRNGCYGGKNYGNQIQETHYPHGIL